MPLINIHDCNPAVDIFILIDECFQILSLTYLSIESQSQSNCVPPKGFIKILFWAEELNKDLEHSVSCGF